jgi:hypothetical protein
MALIYLIYKPQLFGRITKWFLKKFKYDFKIICKPSRLYLAKAFGSICYTSPGFVLLLHNFIPPMHNTMKLFLEFHNLSPRPALDIGDSPCLLAKL